jgi:hypothetical protein
MRRLPVCGVLVGALAIAALPARADRPFLAVTSAAAEEDDDNVWSVAAGFERARGSRALAFSAEYAFEPTRSIELTVERSHPDRSSGIELEYKHLFNHIARDGYGWGVVLGTGAQRSDGGGWRGGAWSLTLPVSLAFAEGDGALHANAGLTREPREQRQTRVAAGVEFAAWRRVTLFAEAAREGDARFAHAGARWWVQRERVALDLGTTRSREDGVRRSGIALAVAWYDL